jgi:hypothetical protein
VPGRDRNLREAERLAVYPRGTRNVPLEDVLSTFEARARMVLDAGELRIQKRRREALEAVSLAHDPLSRFGSRKPSLNEYEGHE